MATRNLERDWSSEDLDLLLSLAWDNLDESLRCHNAGAARAALMMLAGALQAVLLGAVVAYPDKMDKYEEVLCYAKVPPPTAKRIAPERSRQGGT